jgi:arginyl-tRNA synthetase
VCILNWTCFIPSKRSISARVAEYRPAKYGAEARAPWSSPSSLRFGELAIPVAFHLARQLKQAPRSDRGRMVAGWDRSKGSRRSKWRATATSTCGWIAARTRRRHCSTRRDPARSVPGKIIVEHTNINPNKAAHIGHLRNAVLGDTFVRMLRARGRTVEVQNYIDNTGVQVADVVAGFQHLRKMSYDDVQDADERTRFDYYCWDLYAEVSSHPGPEGRMAPGDAARHRAPEGRIGVDLARRSARSSSATTSHHGRLGISAMTCCRARARFFISSSGKRPSSS